MDILKEVKLKAERNYAKRLAAMTPEEREAELKRREERRRKEEEYYLAMKNKTVPYLEYRREIEDLETIIDDLQGQLADFEELQAEYEYLFADFKKSREKHEALSAEAKDKLQWYEEKLKKTNTQLTATRDRMDALIDANLALQKRITPQLDSIVAQGVETRQGVAVLVQHLPDAEKPTVIPWAVAVAIIKAKGGNATDRTLRNWLKGGKTPKTGTPISWDNLASVETWTAWCDAYVAAERRRLTTRKFISEHAAEAETERARRRSPTA